MQRSPKTKRQRWASRWLTLSYVFASAPLIACQAPVLPTPVQVAEFPGANWRTATPTEMAMDPALLDAAVARITSGEIQDIDALVVVRHGRLVLERYFGGSHREDIHTMQSVSKSVASLVVGAAVADGLLSEDDRVLTVLPPAYRVVAEPCSRWPSR
jgi:CubicO group peptidase (beta-lactamase class C family)